MGTSSGTRIRFWARIVSSASCPRSVSSQDPSAPRPARFRAALPDARLSSLVAGRSRSAAGLCPAAGPARAPAAWPVPSDAFNRFQPPRLDRVDELVVVVVVLVGVPLREVGDRFVERVTLAQVLGHGDRVTGPGVGPRQRPPTDTGVVHEPERHHRLDQRRALHVAQLAPVVVTLHVQALRPAEVDVAGGLHQPLPLYHTLAVLAVAALPDVRLENRCRRLLDL